MRRAGLTRRDQRPAVDEYWAPICSATACPLVAIEPECEAGTPRLRFSHAVCSVDLPLPPHHGMERCSTIAFSRVLPISPRCKSGLRRAQRANGAAAAARPPDHSRMIPI